MENIYKLEIRKRVPFGKKGFFTWKPEKRQKEEQGKEAEQEEEGWRREELEAKGFAGLTQVRGVYRCLMGIMG